MNRRRFLNSLVGGVAVAAAARAWPFRVFSFPSAPVITQIFEVPANWERYYALHASKEQIESYILGREVMVIEGYDVRAGRITVRRGI